MISNGTIWEKMNKDGNRYASACNRHPSIGFKMLISYFGEQCIFWTNSLIANYQKWTRLFCRRFALLASSETCWRGAEIQNIPIFLWTSTVSHWKMCSRQQEQCLLKLSDLSVRFSILLNLNVKCKTLEKIHIIHPPPSTIYRLNPWYCTLILNKYNIQ